MSEAKSFYLCHISKVGKKNIFVMVFEFQKNLALESEAKCGGQEKQFTKINEKV